MGIELFFLTSFLVMALGGLINSAHHYYAYALEKKVCPPNSYCATARSQKWAAVFGVRNDLLGVYYYAALFLLVVLALVFPYYAPLMYLLVFLVSGAALLFSLFLLYLLAFVLEEFCFFCVLSAVLAFFLFLNSIVFVW